MKINILTFSKVNSFGANLQCYALTKIIKDMGHDVKIIDLRLPLKKGRFLGRIGDLFCTIQFEKFRRKYFPKFTRKYKDSCELLKHPPIADCYIVGSDQVWNSSIIQRLYPSFYLDFVPDGKTRISYAASFGTENLPVSDEDSRIKEFLSRFNSISVREISALENLKSKFNINGKVVLDPTLLINDYDEIISPKKYGDRELVSFRLAIEANYVERVRKISNQLNLDPVFLNNRRKILGAKYRPFVNVGEWLKSISNASFVITDSFHCLVFSLIFRKNFIVVPSYPERATRLIGLLEMLGISGRFYSNLDDLEGKQEWVEPINYDSVYSRLSQVRDESLLFLRDAIGN